MCCKDQLFDVWDGLLQWQASPAQQACCGKVAEGFLSLTPDDTLITEEALKLETSHV